MRNLERRGGSQGQRINEVCAAGLDGAGEEVIWAKVRSSAACSPFCMTLGQSIWTIPVLAHACGLTRIVRLAWLTGMSTVVEASDRQLALDHGPRTKIRPGLAWAGLLQVPSLAGDGRPSCQHCPRGMTMRGLVALTIEALLFAWLWGLRGTFLRSQGPKPIRAPGDLPYYRMYVSPPSVLPIHWCETEGDGYCPQMPRRTPRICTCHQ